MKGLERIAADRRHLVAMQVRVSSGFTWGRAGANGMGPVVPQPARGVPSAPAAARKRVVRAPAQVSEQGAA